MRKQWNRKAPGQSIPIVALMLVILFAMVGLSVDVGNTYAEQRNVVRATDAAALAGMGTMIKNQGSQTGGSIDAVWQSIKYSLKANKIAIRSESPDNRSARDVTATYLTADKKKTDCSDVSACAVPDDATYIKLEVGGTVDTYFARLVGQKTLPVAATAYGAQCQLKDGVFPLGVSAETATGKTFSLLSTDANDADYWKNYAPQNYPENVSGEYKNDPDYPYLATKATWRRLFVIPNPGTALDPSGFRLLSWQGGAANASAFAGIGTLSKGFVEADEPNDPSYSKIDQYPVHRTQLDPTDWVSGASTADFAGIASELNKHKLNRDTLVLPIVAATGYVGTKEPLEYQVKYLGLFRVANRGAVVNGSQLEVDLAYLGHASATPCLSTDVQPPLVCTNEDGTPCTPPPHAIEGKIFVRPSAKTIDTSRDPIAYQVVLDTSGSMSLDMDGFADSGGSKVLCMYTTSAVNGKTYEPGCYPGADGQTWGNKSERRITQAKAAINKMIDGLNVDGDYGDVMRIISFSTDSADPDSATPKLKVEPAAGWSKDTSPTGDLRTAVKNAGMVGGDPYTTIGATPTPDALQQTLKLLQSSSAPQKYGTKTYKKVVILITDGMPNVFLSKPGNPGKINVADDIPSCQAIGPAAASSTADCQRDKTSSGTPRPIDAMIAQATAIKALDSKLELYVIAVAKVPPVGLTEVPNDPSYLAHADDPGSITTALEQIQNNVKTNSCKPKTAENSEAISSISSANEASFAGHAEPYGYVYIADENGNRLPGAQGTIPILQTPDRYNGQLSWYLPADQGLLLGKKYLISAEVGYKGTDGVARLYTKLYNGSETLLDTDTLQYTGGAVGETLEAASLTLMLDPNVEICPVDLP